MVGRSIVVRVITAVATVTMSGVFYQSMVAGEVKETVRQGAITCLGCTVMNSDRCCINEQRCCAGECGAYTKSGNCPQTRINPQQHYSCLIDNDCPRSEVCCLAGGPKPSQLCCISKTGGMRTNFTYLKQRTLTTCKSTADCSAGQGCMRCPNEVGYCLNPHGDSVDGAWTGMVEPPVVPVPHFCPSMPAGTVPAPAGSGGGVGGTAGAKPGGGAGSKPGGAGSKPGGAGAKPPGPGALGIGAG